MNVCGIGPFLRVVYLCLIALLLITPTNVDGQPGSSANLLRLDDFAAACSKDILDAGTDSMCRQAISMALGKEPVIEEVRNADGTVVRTTRYARPDRGRAGWLGEEACEHGQWQSCMLYVMLLERGDGLPLDRERAETLMHYACANGHRLACQSLHQKGIMPAQNAVLPARPAWVSPQSGPAASPTFQDPRMAALEDWRREQLEKQQQLSPEHQLVIAEAQRRAAQAAAEPPANTQAAEATLIAKCMAASKDACYELAEGYDVGKGMPRDPARAAFYYEKACEAGHSAACARRGKVPGAPAAQSAHASMGVLAGLATIILIGAAVVVVRRRGAAANGGGERPAPVRPAAAPRSSR